MIHYLKCDYVGVYSRKLYAPAGTEVYVIQRSDNMCLVTDISDNKIWIHEKYLTLNKSDVTYSTPTTAPRPKPKKRR